MNKNYKSNDNHLLNNIISIIQLHNLKQLILKGHYMTIETIIITS